MGSFGLQSLGSAERTWLDQLVEELQERVRFRKRLSELNAVEHAVWQTVLRAFAERARAPSLVELGSFIPGGPDKIDSVLQDLAAKVDRG